MMNKFNLIILVITVVVIICIGIYLYKNNSKNNNVAAKEAFYQASSQVNPITIADMATTVMAADAPVHEYAIFKMIGKLNTITSNAEVPLYNSNKYGDEYPSEVKSDTTNSSSIKISNTEGKITLDPQKKYRISLSFNRVHYNSIIADIKTTTMDLVLNSYDDKDERIPAKSIANTATVTKGIIFTTTLDIFTIITGVNYIIPLLRYRDKVTVLNSDVVDSSTYMLIETIN
jgi:hypothetical protein